VRDICLRFPAAEEKLSHGAPSFHVRGKMFLTFVDDHHADGRLAVWCKSSHEEQRGLVARNPARFFVPPYVGVKGWVGVNVDERNADFVELAILVEEAWRGVAPPRLLRGEGIAVAPATRTQSRPVRVTTDEKTAQDALARMTSLSEALPGATRERESRHATFRVGQKVFAYFLDNHHGDGIISACVRGDRRENARLVAKHPERYHLPAYIGPRGYLGIRLNTRDVDWDDVGARMAAAHQMVAPKRAGARSRRK
jgi:hypothetical protein